MARSTLWYARRSTLVIKKPQVRHARTPEDVSTSKTLSVYAKIVYTEMAYWVYEGNACYRGQRAIAKRANISRSTVVEAIEQLSAQGFIEIVAASRGRRQFYILKSELYAQKQGKETVVASSPSRGRRYASVGPDVTGKIA